MNGPLIAWKVFSLKANVASVRYRCLLPVLNLSRLGKSSIVFEEGEVLLCDRVSAMVFVKSFTKSDLALAQGLRKSAVPIVLDLCDNIFVDNYAIDAAVNPVAKFREMARIADAVVVPTEELARKVQGQVSASLRVEVIPDQLESHLDATVLLSDEMHCLTHREMVSPFVLTLFTPKLILRAVLPRLRKFVRRVDRTGRRYRLYRAFNLLPRLPLATWQALQRSRRLITGAVSRLVRPSSQLIREARNSLPFNHKDQEKHENSRSEPSWQRRRVIWFGNHGAAHSPFGMGMLAEVIPALEEINRRIPLELIIVSNNEQKFQDVTRGLTVPAKYHPWQLSTIFKLISAADVCVLPNAKDEFSVCKSPNRAVLALSLGVPVVASNLPSLAPLKECIIIDHWVYGLTTYLTNAEQRERDLRSAAELISREFAGEAVARRWKSLLMDLIEASPNVLDQCMLDNTESATNMMKG
jgi:glycosyltransferase involved in cell wall biosynthesis